MMQALVGDGKPDTQDSGQPGRRGRSECHDFHFARSIAVADPGSYLRRRSFSFSDQLHGRDGSLRRVGDRDLRTPVAQQTEAKEVI